MFSIAYNTWKSLYNYDVSEKKDRFKNKIKTEVKIVNKHFEFSICQ